MKRLIGISAALLLLAWPAWAQQMGGGKMYAGGQIGLSLLHDSDIDDGTGLAQELAYDVGFGLTAFVGTEVTNNVRAELELGYATNSVSEYKVIGIGVDASGDVSAFTVMVNGYYDLDVAPKIRAYLGAGIGYANVSVDSLSALGVPLADDSGGAFAWQIAVGGEYDLNPTTALQLGYSYLSASGIDLNDVSGNALEADYNRSSIRIGARVKF